MSEPVFLGIDIGTTSTKAIVYDPVPGEVVHVASCPTPVRHPRPEWAEWDPDALWDAVARAVREAVARVPASRHIAGIGIASVGEAGIALDEHGKPLRPIIAWFDPRGEEYVTRWQQEMDPRRLYLITGHLPFAIYTAFKFLWLQEQEPDTFARLAHWLFVGDYIAYRMTGEMATVPTLAARSLLFDVVRRRWSTALLEEVGLHPSQMPPVVPTTEPLGRLRPAVAQDLGLPSGIPVTLGGHDHVVGMWLAGITLPGRAVDSSGTAQGIAVEIPRFIGERGFDAQLSCYPMAVGETFILQGGMPTAGAALQWLADLIAEGNVAQVLAWAEEAAPGSGGVGVLPFLRGPGPPYRQGRLRGLIYQIDLATRPQEIARALVEGLACFSVDVVNLLERMSGREVHEVRAIGGLNRHPLVRRIKASVADRPYALVDVPEVVGTAAALLAAIAAGYFAGPAEALENARVHTLTVAPEPAWRPTYETVFRRYRAWVQAALAATSQ